jgi:hypothetical protein
VKEVTSPSSHKMTRTTAMVYSMGKYPLSRLR